MPPTIIPSQLFLPFDSVRLGRFVNNIDQPLEGYHEPTTTEAPKSIVTEYDYTGDELCKSGTRLTSKLTFLLSLGFSKNLGSKTRLSPKHCRTYALDNSDEWFHKAISSDVTKKWIEEAAVRGRRVFMIVGFHTLIDTHFLQESIKDDQLDCQVDAPLELSLAAAGAVIPLPGLIDSSIQMESGSFAGNRAHFFAPGEQVCGMQYREVSYRWFWSRDISHAKVSNTKTWSSMAGKKRSKRKGVSEGNGSEYMFEAINNDFEEPDDGWNVEESDEGLVYIHC
jgi:hypothetical protein